MSELRKLLEAAADELEAECEWNIEREDGQFFSVLEKHISPMINTETYKAARISALKAELSVLENDMSYTNKITQLACNMQIAVINGELPIQCEDASDWLVKQVYPTAATSPP